MTPLLLLTPSPRQDGEKHSQQLNCAYMAVLCSEAILNAVHS